MRGRIKLLNGDRDGNAAPLMVRAAEETGPSICPIAIAKLTRNVEMRAAIRALHLGLDVVKKLLEAQLAMRAFQVKPDSEHATFQ